MSESSHGWSGSDARRRGKRRDRFTDTRGPVFEQLEERRLLSGNITVVLDAGVLTITGDAANNLIEISDDGAGTLTIDTGSFDFTPAKINGVDGPLDFDSDDVTSIVMGLGRGDDYVILNDLQLSGSVSINFGKGNDSLDAFTCVIDGDVTVTGGQGVDAFVIGGGTEIGGDLTMLGGKGNDALQINFGNDIVATSVAGTARLTGGAGADNFFIPQLEDPDFPEIEITTPFGNLILNGGGGQDHFDIEFVEVAGIMILNGGAKDSEVTITGASLQGGLQIHTGHGDDVIEISETSVGIAFDVRTNKGRDSLTLTDVSTTARTFIHMGNDADLLNIESGFIWGLLANGGKGNRDVLEVGESEIFFTQPRFLNFEPVVVNPL